jgi:glycosyltransferase involved in cell wall biosynthesis
MEGLMWFIDKVWPLIHARYPQMKFHVAGRNTPELLKSYEKDNIIIHGEVEQAISFINTHAAMVVPLFSGSGMRVKILEGMALGKPVITTTLGKEGIEADHEKQLLIADTPEEFMRAVERVFEDTAFTKNLGQAAKKFVEDYYDHNHNAEKLIAKYKELQSNPVYHH